MMGDSGLQNNTEQIRLNCGKLKIRATALSFHKLVQTLIYGCYESVESSPVAFFRQITT